MTRDIARKRQCFSRWRTIWALPIVDVGVASCSEQPNLKLQQCASRVHGLSRHRISGAQNRVDSLARLVGPRSAGRRKIACPWTLRIAPLQVSMTDGRAVELEREAGFVHVDAALGSRLLFICLEVCLCSTLGGQGSYFHFCTLPCSRSWQQGQARNPPTLGTTSVRSPCSDGPFGPATTACHRQETGLSSLARTNRTRIFLRCLHVKALRFLCGIVRSLDPKIGDCLTRHC